MPNTISPESLPEWPYTDLKAEEVTILACLLGKHGERPLTGVFGEVTLFWELLRHDKELVELLTKQRSIPTNDDWRDHPGYSTMFESRRGFIISTPGFPDTPLLSLKTECQNQLVKLFTPGQPALEIGDIERLDAKGDFFKRFKQLVNLAKEVRQYRNPEARYKKDAILPRENLNPWESVYDAIFTIRGHMGIEAVRKGFDQWLTDNSNLFKPIDTSLAAQHWRDPRPFLSDLAVLRSVRLYGYSGARNWTKKNRPRKCIMPLKESDYENYFMEDKKPKGNRPLYEKTRQCMDAIERVLCELAQISKH